MPEVLGERRHRRMHQPPLGDKQQQPGDVVSTPWGGDQIAGELVMVAPDLAMSRSRTRCPVRRIART